MADSNKTFSAKKKLFLDGPKAFKSASFKDSALSKREKKASEITTAKNCPSEKPICFRTEKYGQKPEKRCNGTEYNAFDALTNAYYIKNPDAKPDANYNTIDEKNECVKITKTDNSFPRCDCVNFDFAWMTALNFFKEQLNNVKEQMTPETMEKYEKINKLPEGNTKTEEIEKIAKEQVNELIENKEIIQKQVNELRTEAKKNPKKIINFFKIISECMRKNLAINNGVNQKEITDFCDLVDVALEYVEQIGKNIMLDLSNITTPIIKDDKTEITFTEKSIFIFKFVYVSCFYDYTMTADDDDEASAAAKEVKEMQESVKESVQESVKASEARASEAKASAAKVQPMITPINIIDQLDSFFHVGKYVMQNSTHFDTHAFNDICEKFEILYTTYCEKGYNDDFSRYVAEGAKETGAEMSGGFNFKRRFAYVGHRIKTWAINVGQWFRKNPWKGALLVLATVATAIAWPIIVVTGPMWIAVGAGAAGIEFTAGMITGGVALVSGAFAAVVYINEPRPLIYMDTDLEKKKETDNYSNFKKRDKEKQKQKQNPRPYMKIDSIIKFTKKEENVNLYYTYFGVIVDILSVENGKEFNYSINLYIRSNPHTLSEKPITYEIFHKDDDMRGYSINYNENIPQHPDQIIKTTKEQFKHIKKDDFLVSNNFRLWQAEELYPEEIDEKGKHHKGIRLNGLSLTNYGNHSYIDVLDKKFLENPTFTLLKANGEGEGEEEEPERIFEESKVSYDKGAADSDETGYANVRSPRVWDRHNPADAAELEAQLKAQKLEAQKLEGPAQNIMANMQKISDRVANLKNSRGGSKTQKQQKKKMTRRKPKKLKKKKMTRRKRGRRRHTKKH